MSPSGRRRAGGTGRSFECVGEMHPAGPRRIGGRPHLYSWEVVGTAHPYAEDESERMFLTGYSDDMGIPPALPEEAVEIMRGAFERCVEIARRGLRG